MHRFLVAILIAVPALAADRPADIVKYRQNLMKAMGAHMNSMSLIVKKQISDRSQLAAHAASIRDLSGDLAAFFPPDTSSQATRTAAKKEIWQRLPEFKSAAAKLHRESATLAENAKRGDASAVAGQFENVANTCAACHRDFRLRSRCSYCAAIVRPHPLIP